MLDDDVLFIEKQRFHQLWLWILLLGINGLCIAGVILQVFLGREVGDKPMSDAGILILAGLLLTITLFIASLRLHTTIRKEGIYVRFFPFHMKVRQYSWNNLSKVHIRKYSPIFEYGGWGLRIGLFGRGTAYNVSGNMGLQLEFSDGSKLLIGTRKPEELTEVLKKIGQLKS